MARPGTFQKGNKLGKGRPKLPAEAVHARELARKFTPEAIEGLVKMARAEDTPAAVRRGCWVDLVEIGWGKPAQALDMSHSLGDGMSELLTIIRGEAPKP